MKNSTTKIIVGVVIVLVVVLGIWFTVGRPPVEEPVAEEPAAEEPAAEEPAAEEPEEPVAIYPMDTDIVLTYWSGAVPVMGFTSFADHPMYQYMMERTGIRVEFTHPPEGQGLEQLNLMIASGDMPDIIEWNWRTFPGGPEKVLADGIARPLNDIIESYAPNFKRLMVENAEWQRMALTDTGVFYKFPAIRDNRGGNYDLHTWLGPIVRRDWLDELGLPLPETMDDWHAMLTAFKNEMGATAPLTYHSNMWQIDGAKTFMSAFGVTRGFFQVDGEVQFGPMLPGFRDFLETYSRWYAEGLLDPEIATVDGMGVNARMLGGQSGATVAQKVGVMGMLLQETRDIDRNDYDLVGVVNPVLNRGDLPIFGHLEPAVLPGGAIITTAADERAVEIAARFIDFHYSEEGHMIWNFGQEGVSYEMVDGEPTILPLVYEDPDGRPITQSYPMHARAATHGLGPALQDQRYIWQYARWPQQEDANSRWATHLEKDHMLPPITPSPEEATELATIMTEVNALRDEMFLRIVLGEAGIEEWDEFVVTIEEMGIQRAIEINQAAFDRYEARNLVFR